MCASIPRGVGAVSVSRKLKAVPPSSDVIRHYEFYQPSLSALQAMTSLCPISEIKLNFNLSISYKTGSRLLKKSSLNLLFFVIIFKKKIIRNTLIY